MNKRYIIVGNGENHFTKLYHHQAGDIMVACDGGYKAIKSLQLPIDIFVGDFDSLSSKTIDELKTSEVHIFKSVKNDSDLKLALDICLKKDKEDVPIIIYNATGKRIDHFLATIRMLKQYPRENIYLIDKYNWIYIKKRSFEVEKNDYKYISFFNIYIETTISLVGFKYPLRNYKMDEFDCLCLSNEILTTGRVIINKPIIVIHSKD